MENYHSTNDPNIAVVIRIHRSEIEALGFRVPDDYTMEDIAGKLEGAILSNDWWTIVRIVCEEIGLPKIDEKENEEGIDNSDDVW